MSFRTGLIIVNAVVIAGLLGYIFYRVVSLRRNPQESTPENLTPFYSDEVLENAHLERVLGTALIALIIVVLGLVAYFVWEPFRGADAADGFTSQSIHRGAVLFAQSGDAAYNPTVSLLCASCHGSDGSGGSKDFIIQSSDPRCDPSAPVTEELEESQPYCLPTQVAWAAPSLQRASLIYSRSQLYDIITYGRPGTPMPAWGVKSGRGSLNDQSVRDLVNYVESIGQTVDGQQKVNEKALDDYLDSITSPEAVAAAEAWVTTARTDLASAEAALAIALAPDSVATAQAVVDQQRSELEAAEKWLANVQDPQEGAVLFQSQCARCHTRGWSYFDPLDPSNAEPGVMAGGALGPSLLDGTVNEQFPGQKGEAQLYSWISDGAVEFAPYGVRGISSGKMPHFGAMLSKEQIEAIMAYERSA